MLFARFVDNKLFWNKLLKYKKLCLLPLLYPFFQLF